MQKEEKIAKGKFSLEDSVEGMEKQPAQEQVQEQTSEAPELAEEAEEEEKDLKSLISALKKEYKKAQKAGDYATAAEAVGKLADAYKEKGDIKRSQKLIEKQNELTITALESMQKKLVNRAKEAQKEGDMEMAAKLYAECGTIASDLFKAGKMEQADWVKKFKSLENRCREQM